MADSFHLANMVDELVELTLTLCGKDENKTLRFPKAFYDSYVSYIVSSAMEIQKAVILANESRDVNLRLKLQNNAESYCVLLNHQIRVAWSKGWISEKQRDRWQSLTTSIKWTIRRWK